MTGEGEGVEGYSTSCIHWGTDTKTIGWAKEKTLDFYLRLPPPKKVQRAGSFFHGKQTTELPPTPLQNSLALWLFLSNFFLLINPSDKF